MWFFLSSPMITLDTHYFLKLLRGNYKKISKIFYKTNNIKTEEKQQPAYLCLLKDQSIKNTKYDPPNYLLNALGWQIINLLNADTWTCYTWKWRFWKSCLLIPLNLQKTMNADVKPFSKNARPNFLNFAFIYIKWKFQYSHDILTNDDSYSVTACNYVLFKWTCGRQEPLNSAVIES